MALSSLIAKIPTRKQRQVVSLIVSANQIVISHLLHEVKHVASLPVTGTDATRVVAQLLQQQGVNHSDVHLVLGHGLYQSLLIDNPGLSDEDKRSALPFQIKDYISDSPSEIVADGYGLPVANRYQVFVCNKSLLAQLDDALKKNHCRLTNVSVEDVLLRQWTALDKAEMVLSQDGQGAIQLSVFSLGKLCFQRQVRGVMFDGVSLSPSVVDDLALEIQRSLDYLRSQLKEAQVSGLVVSVQAADNTELAFQLSSRLTVKVRPQTLFDSDDHLHNIALAALDNDSSPDINLFSDDLRQSTPLLSFERMLLCWGVSAFMLVLVAAYQQWQLSNANQALKVSASELKVAQTLSDELNSQLKLHLPSVSMVNDTQRAQESVRMKKAALDAVRQHDKALQQGHADTFRALATLSRRDVSVSDIFVSQGALNIQGSAASPDAVPAWLQSFETQPPLSHRVFEHMALVRDENDRLTFNLQSKRESEEGKQ
ncbi:MSHA biogenesis protein MshI [Enterovibrio norvegicus]|uniref:MSHA biogenesis protein MshI n=1 Tax=Enterovibrio norvegicus TaxID=188144 RepID=UPI000C8562C7|nr:MSHA biogenesis protein MshI [Enterovibrio norvegicus]PMN68663.1 MSHA biogenesis protein MshI [Enterovibrio norvegicus]